MKNLITFKTFVLALIFLSGFVMAQNIIGKSVKVSVDGTSPLHNWTMSSNSGSFTGTVNGNAINNIKFTMPAKKLKSTKGKMMDNKAYNALKSDKNPNINFNAASLNIGKSNLSGKLTVAGVTKNVIVPVTVVKNGNSYQISGSSNMKMSDFGMETPGFLGVRTGDAITVKVNIIAN